MILNFNKLVKSIILISILEVFIFCSKNKNSLITITTNNIIFKKYKITKILDANKKVFIYFTKGSKINKIEIIKYKNDIIVKAKYNDNFLINEVNYFIQNSVIKDMIFYGNTNVNIVKVKSIRYVWMKHKNISYFIEEIKPYISKKYKNEILLFRNVYRLTNKRFIESEMIYVENGITNNRYLNYKEHNSLIKRFNLDKVNDIININSNINFPKKIYNPQNKKYISNIIKFIFPIISEMFKDQRRAK